MAAMPLPGEIPVGLEASKSGVEHRRPRQLIRERDAGVRVPLVLPFHRHGPEPRFLRRRQTA